MPGRLAGRSPATFRTGAAFVGDVLALTSITAETGATFRGRLLARNGAVTLDTNTITNATCAPLAGGGGPTTTVPAPDGQTPTGDLPAATPDGPAGSVAPPGTPGSVPSLPATGIHPLLPVTGLALLALGVVMIISSRRHPDRRHA